jgi:enoyl-[acyl-carrier protein] reductase I
LKIHREDRQVSLNSDNFMKLDDRHILVFGVANKRSVAYVAAMVLEKCGADITYAVKDAETEAKCRRLLGAEARIRVCDLRKDEDIQALHESIKTLGKPVQGILHSVAFANYSQGFGPFHETERSDFLEAMDVSMFSLVRVCNVFRDLLSDDATVVTISISTTRMAAQNYGYMGPIKAALDSSVAFLAKSLGDKSDIRVNAVGAGLLKTSSSAGIPGYVDSYLYAEKVTPRGRNLDTQEVADTVVFLLSPRSSGITAQTLIVDAGMSVNYFDNDIVKKVV